MDFNKIKELIKALVTDSTSTEEAEAIGKINQEIDNAEQEYNGLIEKHEEMRQKYIKAITNASFNEKPKEDNPQPKSLEECMQEIVDNRKD